MGTFISSINNIQSKDLYVKLVNQKNSFHLIVLGRPDFREGFLPGCH